MSKILSKGDVVAGARVRLALGLLDQSNAKNFYPSALDGSPVLAMTASDVPNAVKLDASDRPRSQVYERVFRRDVRVTAVLKTKIRGLVTRKGDVLRVECPAPYTGADSWIAVARVSGDDTVIISLDDLSADVPLVARS